MNFDNPPPKRPSSRDAIVEAARRLFLQAGFDGVSMDDLAVEAGVARRTLYNQFSTKEDILREVIASLSGRIGAALPPGIEATGDVSTVLRRMATAVMEFQASPEFIGLVRLVVADSRQRPWIAQAFASVLDPQLDRFARYLSDLTAAGILDCPSPHLAAHQFLGLLNEPVLWQRVLGRAVVAASDDSIVDEAVLLFLARYRGAGRPVKPKKP